MKYFKLIIILLFLFIITGCTNDRGLILLNNSPVTQSNALSSQKVFRTGEKVYYLFIAPKKIQNEYIRVQAFSLTDKYSSGGIDVVRTKDFRLNKDERYYYTDYFTFWEKGRYGIQVFSHDDFKKPLAVSEFFIQ